MVLPFLVCMRAGQPAFLLPPSLSLPVPASSIPPSPSLPPSLSRPCVSSASSNTQRVFSFFCAFYARYLSLSLAHHFLKCVRGRERVSARESSPSRGRALFFAIALRSSPPRVDPFNKRGQKLLGRRAFLERTLQRAFRGCRPIQKSISSY
jgi:hypothetical protein